MIRWVTQNIGWKLLSLGLAFGLWLAVVGEPEMASTVAVPIQYKHIPPDLEIGSEIPERVHLEVQGPGARLQNFNLASAAVVLDLSPVSQPGERTFTIDQRTLTLPVGVHLLHAMPPQLRIVFERRASREVPVRVRISGAPAKGYRVAGTLVRPETLKIVGPEKRVRRVESAETDLVDVASATASSEFHVHAFVDDPHVRFDAAPHVTVKVLIEKIPPKENVPRAQKTVRN
jgi:YbbR domain-containing protein